jgi:V/A-type H+-transporting ATPase subunit B
MKDGVGKDQTREDHMEVSNQLYDAYSRAQELRALAEIVGKAGLSGVDLKYLQYGDIFEQKFLKQSYLENRTLEDTLRLAWEALSILPTSELTKIKDSYVKEYYTPEEKKE